jgi:hypothetical protein
VREGREGEERRRKEKKSEKSREKGMVPIFPIPTQHPPSGFISH